MESFEITDSTYLPFEYKAYVQDLGLQDWRSSGFVGNPTNVSKFIEAFAIRIVGQTQHSVSYAAKIEHPNEGIVTTRKFRDGEICCIRHGGSQCLKAPIKAIFVTIETKRQYAPCEGSSACLCEDSICHDAIETTSHAPSMVPSSYPTSSPTKSMATSPPTPNPTPDPTPFPTPNPTPDPTSAPIKLPTPLVRTVIENARSGRRLFAQSNKSGRSGFGALSTGNIWADQNWHFREVGCGSGTCVGKGSCYLIESKHSGRRIYAQGGNTWTSGVGAISANSRVYQDQKWALEESNCNSGDTCYIIRNVHSCRRLYAQPDKEGDSGVGADNGGTVYSDQKWNLLVRY